MIAGLGNPGEEYDETRHNAGRSLLRVFQKTSDFSEWTEDKKKKMISSKGKIGKESVTLLLPNNFMNNSGGVLKNFVLNPKQAEKLVVLYDDIDLPLGKLKISYDRSSGGHNGVESIIKSLKTKAFTRLRIGIAPEDAKGRARKPKGEEKVLKFLLSSFKKDEKDILKKLAKKTNEAIETIVTEGKERAMEKYNSQ